MAYFYPQNYQQNYQPQIQSGGIIRVTNEEEARKYPVAPGFSVTFIDENGSNLYTKTAGFSQFEAPRFEKYRLIKQNEAVSEPGKEKTPEYATKAEIEALRAEFEAIKEKLDD